jgi:AcrR family transcriptional regulator
VTTVIFWVDAVRKAGNNMTTVILRELVVRITEEAKRETRRRILDASVERFKSNGFDETTTKEIARRAGIASGTLFNYFATKEAIVMTLVAEALEQAHQDFEKKRPTECASLAEDLFAHVAAGLRRMKPFRKFIHPALESALSPLSRAGSNEEAELVRLCHLEVVSQLITEKGASEPPSTLALHLYWTLYTGVLAYWANDSSPKQEDTLSLLDQSLRMFVSWLETNPPGVR